MDESLRSKYTAHFLPGRGRRGGSSRIGVVHAVKKCNGDNFNTSLCGKKPTGISLGWQEETYFGITCQPCINELEFRLILSGPDA